MKKEIQITLTITVIAAVVSLMSMSHSTKHHNKTNADPYSIYVPIPEAKPIPSYVDKSMSWLAAAQQRNGGWGAGSHSRQDLKDPQAIKTDPGTTAFAAMALLRSGNTLNKGKYSENVKRALDHLLEVVENAPENSTRITDVTGTQPQTKLGQNIDASLVSQFLTRILAHCDQDSKLHSRVSAGIDVCVTKIQNSQQGDGSFAGGTWAPVLQSAMANTALEEAVVAGARVDRKVLKRSRDYQKSNYNEVAGSVDASSAAGVAFYSVSSNRRANAKEARKAMILIEKAKREGKLDEDAEITVQTLSDIGVSDDEAKDLEKAYNQNVSNASVVNDERVMAGFGNNGGEEFLSYMQTSESMIITGGKSWDDWNTKMHTRMAKIQNPNGSWSGHHCISSPVFCTAAVILTLTTDQDAEILCAVTGIEDNKNNQ